VNIDGLIEELAVRIDGALISQVCLDFTVYTYSNFFREDTTEGVRDFYRQVIDNFGSSFNWYLTETSTGPRKVDSKALEMFPFWFSTAAKRRTQYILVLRNGDKNDDIGSTSFTSYSIGKGDYPGFLRLTLPATSIAEGTNRYIRLCMSLVRKLPFLSGRAGYSLHWFESGYKYYRKGLAAAELIARRYPGIDIPQDNLTMTEQETPKAIRPINWLTFLGSNFMERIGGVDHLRTSLGSSISVAELPAGGVMIQAGDEPGTGDTNRGIGLPEYHKVGRALKSIRMKRHVPIVSDMEGWMARFDNGE
jgi:Protein of unknown function (DUF3396)